MEVKLLVLDLDGTLLNSHKEISEHNRDVLLKAQEEKGLRIAIGSGREVAYAERVSSCLQLKSHNGFMIANNGQQICDYQNEHLITGPTISREALSICASFSLEHSVECHGSLKGVAYTPEEKEGNHVFLSPKGNPAEYLDKVVFMPAGSREDVRREQESLRQHLGVLAECFLVAPHVIDVAARGVNKVTAIGQVCRIMGISREEVLVMGDGENDLACAQYYPFSAMSNAMEEVIEAADRTTLSNDEDGVAYEVERTILNCA